jgi:hypothetical protein
MLAGRCHCGAIRYEMPDEVPRVGLCHCSDCRRHSGAPMVAWALLPRAEVKIEGEPRAYKSSEHAERLFCGDCGTSLFYVSETYFPGQIDVQTATLDDPGALSPTEQVQVAERIPWMEHAHELPMWERYPG